MVTFRAHHTLIDNQIMDRSLCTKHIQIRCPRPFSVHGSVYKSTYQSKPSHVPSKVEHSAVTDHNGSLIIKKTHCSSSSRCLEYLIHNLCTRVLSWFASNTSEKKALKEALFVHCKHDYLLLYKKIYPVDFDDELKGGDIRYDNSMTKITIKVQLIRRLPYET